MSERILWCDICYTDAWNCKERGLHRPMWELKEDPREPQIKKVIKNDKK